MKCFKPDLMLIMQLCNYTIYLRPEWVWSVKVYSTIEKKLLRILHKLGCSVFVGKDIQILLNNLKEVTIVL